MPILKINSHKAFIRNNLWLHYGLHLITKKGYRFVFDSFFSDILLIRWFYFLVFFSIQINSIQFSVRDVIWQRVMRRQRRRKRHTKKSLCFKYICRNRCEKFRGNFERYCVCDGFCDDKYARAHAIYLTKSRCVKWTKQKHNAVFDMSDCNTVWQSPWDILTK